MSVVIIPAYKPDQALRSITDQLWDYGCRIIVVDDGSGEEYQQVFDQIEDICIVLRHRENRGKGAAIKTALSYIKQEIWGDELIGIMDCDGQHLPEDMMKLFRFAERHRKTLVLGVRAVGKEMPLRSRAGNRITRWVYRLISGVKVSDTQTGLRAFGSELTEKFLSVEGERYEYEMNVLMACAKAKIPIEEVQISTIYRDRNNSNSHFRSYRDSVRIYKEILKFTLSPFSAFFSRLTKLIADILYRQWQCCYVTRLKSMIEGAYMEDNADGGIKRNLYIRLVSGGLATYNRSAKTLSLVRYKDSKNGGGQNDQADPVFPVGRQEQQLF